MNPSRWILKTYVQDALIGNMCNWGWSKHSHIFQEDFEKRGMTKKHLYKRCDTGTTGCVKHNLELAEQTKRKMHNTENRHAAKKKKQDSAQAAAVAAKHRKGKYVAQKQRIDSLAKKAKEEDENMENATEELLKKNMHSSTRVRGDTGRKWNNLESL